MSSIGMYQVKPYYSQDVKLSGTSCMYELPSYVLPPQTQSKDLGLHDVECSSKEAELVKMLEQQKRLLAKLHEIELTIDKFSCPPTSSSGASMCPATSAAIEPVPSPATTTQLQAVEKLPSDVVIHLNASSANSVLPVIVMLTAVSEHYNIKHSVFVHSSTKKSGYSEHLAAFLKSLENENAEHDLHISIVLKSFKVSTVLDRAMANCSQGVILFCEPRFRIFGVPSVCRFLDEYLIVKQPRSDPATYQYWMDKALNILPLETKAFSFFQTISKQLQLKKFITGDNVTSADFILWCALNGSKDRSIPMQVQQWLNRMSETHVMSLVKSCKF